MVTLYLTFWGTATLFSNVAAPVNIPTSNVWGFQFLHILTKFLLSVFFFYSYYSELWSGISLWLWFAFLWWLIMLNIFNVLIRCSCIFLDISNPFLLMSFIYSGYRSHRKQDLQIFSLFNFLMMSFEAQKSKILMLFS